MGKIEKLTIIVPVFNERGTIEEILRRLESVGLGGVQKEKSESRTSLLFGRCLSFRFDQPALWNKNNR